MDFITKNNYTYERLKDEIIEGKIKPGERIVMPDVAKRYGVSAMPVREALNRLHQDGLVETIPHVGARVVSIDLEKFKEIMMIRFELEALATKVSTPFIDDQILEKLELLHADMGECSKKEDYSRYSKLNKKFHFTIYSAGPYSLLFDLIESLWTRSEFSRTIFLKFSERPKTSMEQHERLLKAIKAGDPDLASQMIRQQNDSAYNMILAVLRDKEETKISKNAAVLNTKI